MLSIDTSEHSVGWSAYFSEAVAQAGAQVLLQIAAETGAKQAPRPNSALEVRELRVNVEGRASGFASGLLRDIPIMRIEAAINQSAHRRPPARPGTRARPGATYYTARRHPVPPATDPASGAPATAVDDRGPGRLPQAR